MNRLAFVLLLAAFSGGPLSAQTAHPEPREIATLVIRLEDGSQIVGTTRVETLTLNSDAAGGINIPLVRIKTIKFAREQKGRAKLILQNGDILQGTVKLGSIDLMTSFGKVTVPIQNVRELETQLKGTVRAIDWEVLAAPGLTGGAAARISESEILLQGRPVRTQQTYATPLRIECDVILEERSAADGSFDLTFLPVDQSANNPDEYQTFRMIYSNTGDYGSRDRLLINNKVAGEAGRDVWIKVPYEVKGGHLYHMIFEVEATELRITIDDQTYQIKKAGIPFEKFYLKISGWQPANRWHVKAFTIR